LYIACLFLLIFAGIAYLFVINTTRLDKENFKNHATIVADNIWSLNKNGAEAYLQLALQANHYKSLSVSLPVTGSYISVTSPPLTKLSLFLHRIKLIGLKELSQEISYENQVIGTLHGEQYIRVIFPLINILVFLLLLLLTTIFIIHLFKSKHFLELQVQERTRNLVESESRFHDLVNLLPEMVLETDLTGKITYANKVAIDQLQLSVTEDTDTNFFLLIQTDERQEAKRNFQNTLEGKPSKLIKCTAIGRKGTAYPILIHSAPITTSGKVSGARMLVIDITERQLLEEQLNRDQKMKAIGLMAGGVAHDLNNILSGVVSYPDLLLLKMDKENELRPALKSIRRSGLEASEVVSDLLTVARGIAAKKESTSLNILTQAYLNSTDFQQLKTENPLIDFNISLAPELRNISCSPIHVRKCLMNLIINGVEAIQGKGTLSIATSNHDHQLPLAEGKQDSSRINYTKVTIHDTGSGISPNDIDHIFEPFYTKKVMGRSGTGLGLAVVWNTMSDHGGTVNVFSDSHGTTFELYFPSIESRVAKLPEQADWKDYVGHGETILVIDDEPRQREIASELLTLLEYSVQTVPSGEAAVEYSKSHSTDLLLLDMIMLPGQNGRKTFEQILKIHPGQKAIIASGFAENVDVRATLEMGANTFIPKPYTLLQLALTIHKTLRP
jgi:PAS domain S-box-containing protein